MKIIEALLFLCLAGSALALYKPEGFGLLNDVAIDFIIIADTIMAILIFAASISKDAKGDKQKGN